MREVKRGGGEEKGWRRREGRREREREKEQKRWEKDGGTSWWRCDKRWWFEVGRMKEKKGKEEKILCVF